MTGPHVVDDPDLTGEDTEAVRRFTEFCASCGPPRPVRHSGQTIEDHDAAVEAWRASLTPEQAEFRQQVIADPEWRAFVGLPPLTEEPTRE